MEQYFDVILSGNDVYMKAAKILGLLPEECVAIEDSATGILSAANAGYITIAIPNAYTIHHDLSPADLIIDGNKS